MDWSPTLPLAVMALGWADYTVGGGNLASQTFHHRTVGDLRLERSTFLVENTPRWRMVLHLPLDGETESKVQHLVAGWDNG